MASVLKSVIETVNKPVIKPEIKQKSISDPRAQIRKGVVAQGEPHSYKIILEDCYFSRMGSDCFIEGTVSFASHTRYIPGSPVKVFVAHIFRVLKNKNENFVLHKQSKDDQFAYEFELKSFCKNVRINDIPIKNVLTTSIGAALGYAMGDPRGFDITREPKISS